MCCDCKYFADYKAKKFKLIMFPYLNKIKRVLNNITWLESEILHVSYLTSGQAMTVLCFIFKSCIKAVSHKTSCWRESPAEWSRVGAWVSSSLGWSFHSTTQSIGTVHM